MKKKIIFLTVILSLLLGTIAYGVHLRQVKKELETKIELEYLYYDQNTVFGICRDYSKRFSYHSLEDADMNEIAIDIYAYNNAQSEYELTLDELIDYLSEEFDSSGKPRIYSQPQNIKDYIKWFYIKGQDEKLFDKFKLYFLSYLKDNAKPAYWEMSYEEVVANLEGFQKDSEHNPFIKEG